MHPHTAPGGIRHTSKRAPLGADTFLTRSLEKDPEQIKGIKLFARFKEDKRDGSGWRRLLPSQRSHLLLPRLSWLLAPPHPQTQAGPPPTACAGLTAAIGAGMSLRKCQAALG